MRKHITTAATLLLLAATSMGKATEEVKEPEPRIQMAILLDTSGSMSGLINQARTELWKIVNEFATATKGEKRPILEVGLYEYGNSGIQDENWVRQLLPLTTDLDGVSESLFSLTTNGGSEYCGAVILSAARSLNWSESNDDLKAIFIAGNEPFTQGGIPYQDACKEAVSKGITVTTIHCGDQQTGINTGWKDGAALADGSYMHIDHNKVAAHIEAPQDAEIARLGAELNNTYVAYGSKGKAAAANQSLQDANARQAAPAVMAERSLTKASAHYRNASWDLVDAINTDAVELAEIDKEDLPEEMQTMSQEEREAFLEKKAQERTEIQEKIQELNKEREAFLAAERKKRAAAGEDTLESAMIEALRGQAAKKQFQLK